MNGFEFDAAVREDGYPVVCGVDEAGRGPLAGRVYAAACILPGDLIIEGLDDSKKLSPKKRDLLYDIIIANAEDYAVAFADEKEIDALNILEASMLAMRRAAEQLKKADIYLVDGNRHPKISGICRPIIKGDSKSASISAASILAKVSRDRYMDAMALKYPQYGFEKHKGYPVAEHYERIAEYGTCEIHRLTFLKNYEEKHKPKAVNKGAAGEQAASEWLEKQGFSLIERNFYVQTGEIDIIALDGDTVCFVEVKQRSTGAMYAPAEAVTRSKQSKIISAAMEWLTRNDEKRPFRFDIVEISGNEISIMKNAFGR